MAVLTITTDAGQTARFAAAVQMAQRLPAPATNAECKTFVIGLLRQFVQQQEHIAQLQALTDTPFDPT